MDVIVSCGLIPGTVHLDHSTAWGVLELILLRKEQKTVCHLLEITVIYDFESFVNKYETTKTKDSH